MPLDHGKSKEAFSRNVATEMKAGKPQKQAVAIMLSEKRNEAKHGGKYKEGKRKARNPFKDMK